MAENLKEYTKMLLFAFLGRNPFRAELDALHEDYRMAVNNISELQNLYCGLVEKMTDNEKNLALTSDKLLEANEKLASNKTLIEGVCKQRDSYQQLVENLRERLNEKDMIITHIKRDYQERIKAYNVEINRLRKHTIRKGIKR